MTAYVEVRAKDTQAKGVARLLHQFARATKYRALVGTKLERWQRLENAIWQFIDALSLESDKSFALDLIGQILNRRRNGLSNDDFRLALRAQIAILRNGGRLKDLFIIFGLTVPTKTMRQITYRLAVLVWMVESAADINPSVVWENLRQATASVRTLYFGYSQEPPATQLRFGWSGNPTLNNGSNGFGWSGDVTLGGKSWAEFVES